MLLGTDAGRAATAAPTRELPGAPEREEKGRTGRPAAPRACAPACLRAPRACTPRASARPACLRAPRARTLRASALLRVCAFGVLPHVLPARPCDVQLAPSGAPRRVLGTRPTASNHNPSPLSSAAGKFCDLAASYLDRSIADWFLNPFAFPGWAIFRAQPHWLLTD